MADSPIESLDYFLTTTKQVRRRLDLNQQVPTEMVLECIDLASRAPIGGNLERNRWLLVDDAETRLALADLYARFGRGYLEAGQKQIESMGNDSTAARVVESSMYLLEHLHEVPLMIIPIKLDRPGTTTFEQATYWGSVTPGVWSLQLALRARGIGSAWTTLHLQHEEDAAELLGLPASVTQIALLPTAYFTGDGFHPARRRSAQEITYYNRWKEPVPEAT